ncbi:alpha/beta fold hydrolase [Flavobacteriaceae bacterium TP-CH-4]|uniref:Alpha/beta fold hydrolase n=1 Tax=Pelagihabitans pacificus TaxID=2696054 RepID=A0A967AQU4_9FLAO|nr:alpha/beta fold hydrolase [Pelagihabitans pacificus]NHF58297.1 alpha/beta fold hydrolase [Pelagihabitans pacificus]
MPLLHSIILGEGTPLLILHGFLGMSDNWKSLGNLYAKEGLQVHLIDQRNHGRSFHSEEFNYEVLSQDLKNYMDHYRLAEAIILGHSMGGKTAMQFACSYPVLTRKLLVADIAPKFYPPHHQSIINGLLNLDFDQISSRSEADGQLASHISDWGIRQFLLKNLYWVDKDHLGFRFNLKILSERMEEIGESIGSTDTYYGPTLFLRGDRSEYITEGDLPEIERHFPNATLTTIENAGHWLHAENPKQFFAQSLAFINS